MRSGPSDDGLAPIRIAQDCDLIQGVCAAAAGRDRREHLRGRRPVLHAPAGVLGAGAVLLVATVMLALLVLSVTILNSARKERTALVLTAVTAAVIAGVLFTLLSAPDDLREGILMSAAVSTLAGATFGLIAIQIVLARNFSAHIPLDSLARVVLVGTVLAYAASMWPVQSFVMMVAKAVVVAVLFLVGLFVAREVKDSDISAIGRIVGRKS